MAYSKQTWDTTSYVNPTRMNHIEDGIESASTATGTEYSSGVSVKDKIDWVFLKNMYQNDTQDISGYMELLIFIKVAGGQIYNSYNILVDAIGSNKPFNVNSYEDNSHNYHAVFNVSNNVLTLTSATVNGWQNCYCMVYGKK